MSADLSMLDLFRLDQSIGDEYAPLGHGRSAVTTGNRLPPGDLELLVRELVDESRLAPHAVALGTSPLRPIIATRRV